MRLARALTVLSTRSSACGPSRPAAREAIWTPDKEKVNDRDETVDPGS